MIIAFGTAATADVLPVGFIMLALAIAIKSTDNEIGSKFFAALLFGFAIIIKYNSIYFAGAFLAVAFLKRSKEYRSVALVSRDVAIYASLPLILLVTYIFWLDTKFGIFVSNGLAGGSPNFLNVSRWILTFAMYLAFVGLGCGPSPIALVARTIKTFAERFVVFVIAIVVVGIGWFMLSLQTFDEMNLGGGLPYGQLAARGLNTLGFLFGACFCIVVLNWLRIADPFRNILLSGCIPYTILISASRPSQRYLILVAPMVLILLIDASSFLSSKLRNLTLGLTALGFAAVSLLGLSYLRGQGNASENMAVWMERNYVIDQTSAFPISVHAGQHFYGLTPNEIRYEVVQTSLEGEKLIKERVLHREPMNVLGRITRVYVLRELPKAP
jgi:hypothetical protein